MNNIQDRTEQSQLLRTNLSNRIYGLDILRAYAILSVLYGHTIEYIPEGIIKISNFFFFDGVSMFFILSGFLIGRILINTVNDPGVNKSSLLKFWINRWIRTLPPYYFTLILIFTIAYIFNLGLKPDFMGMKKQLSYFFFLQNLNWPHFGFFAESWSLAVEEWFYILVPLVIFIFSLGFRLKPKESIFISVLVVIIISPIYRYYYHMSSVVFETHTVLVRLDSIIYGVLGAFIAYYYKSFWEKYKILMFIIGILLLFSSTYAPSFINLGYDSMLYKVFYFSVVAIAVSLLLPVLSTLKKGQGIIYKVLTYISLISYSLYLLHYTLIKYCFVEEITKNMPNEYIDYIRLLAIWILSFALATLGYLYLEKPCMDIRTKIKFLKK